ncbi:Scy1p NDAI_0I01190 [Naumovozyma dairenensis CBS 421]|uniref:Protein kinase domain-containing protein n=1 Tax=Naumovozyma dairenensis (strain ATCC 10597 / BCRC 20456 / CBS 421 / NBRC 0211 / NRRL Y-12639) TaxID=1071378 RepID=G0WFX7_NAUDC|nr:hypothetical protein NDAI_0I01190 [Naumovozyma dairenensis CBS 421]CCD26688.1 hypothetical protein NDAI_0I01190 [Naumovozyma dairenensis CBS 421]
MMFWSSKSGISSKYTFSSSPTFTADPWSVYTGRPKSTSSSSPSKVSIFSFDKKFFENYLLKYGIIKSKSSSQDKNLIQEGYEVLRKQVNNLAKLKHPNILTLIEPLEEHSKSFLFVTEFVTGSLDIIFNTSQDNEEQNFFKDYNKDQIVIQRGILQLVNGLDFIHSTTNSVHLNIQPKSIFVNENSDWKLSGLGHLMKLPQGSNTDEYSLPMYDPRIPSFMQLNFDYSAPELMLDHTLTCKNDYFSLALLINFLYCGENIILRSENSVSQYKDEYSNFERKISTLSWDKVFIKLPVKLRHCMPSLMNRDIYSRYNNITDFLESEFFQDPLIKTLNFLDELPTKGNDERLVFLDGLVELLPDFPTTLLQKKFLPILLDLLNQLCTEKNLDLRCISRNVELVLKIGSSLSQLSFHEKVYPVLTHKINFPILLKKSTLSLIENLKILKDSLKLNEFLDIFLKPILNFVLKENDSDSTVIRQEKLLAQLSLILECFDFPTVKNYLLPLISTLFTKTTSLTIKINVVSCFKIFIEQKAVDSYICCDEILPLFKSMKTRDPRILMASLQLFEVLPGLIKDEVGLVEQVLPLLWSYSMSSTLKVEQYIQYSNVIEKLSEDVKQRHLKKLGNSTDLKDLKQGNAFNKIIDTPIAPVRTDMETQTAKNIKVPAIHPTKKTATPPLSASSIPPKMEYSSTEIPKRAYSQQQRTVNTNLQGKDRVTWNPPLNLNPAPISPVSNNTHILTPARSSYATLQQQQQQQQQQQPMVTSTNLQNSTTKNELSGLAFTSQPSISPLQPMGTSSKFPPGFSIPLQPNRKPDNAMANLNSFNTRNDNSASLI